jgi:hypothetical protein
LLRLVKTVEGEAKALTIFHLINLDELNVVKR